MKVFAFELTLLCLLTCTAFPVVFAISSEFAQSWNERVALLVSAGIALCLAGIWVMVMLY
ncbi:MAG: hypothetical protein HY661_00170 [Betaproteobacteria bacterium]|nr:hypothetical protein [Betaproteobacteria bacterium]